ncbi:MAG: hypothetical protein ABR549_17425 [Mycobacteriales bacterium]
MRRSGAGLVTAGLGCVLGAVFPGVHAFAAGEPGSGFGSYALSAAAPGAQLTVGEPTYCYTNPAGLQGCDGDVSQATSNLSNGPNGSATAAVVWPGALAADIGSLLITASNGALPDQARTLNDPVRAQVQTGQSPDTVTYDSVPGVTMKAVAKADLTSADSHVQSLDATSIGTFGPMASSSVTKLTGPKAALATATSSASDIDIAGVLHIGSVHSTATATTDGTTAKVTGRTIVSNATVAGVPVTIDEHGVSVQGNGVALKTLTETVNSALAQSGLVLRVSEPQGKPIGSAAAYNAGSLVAVWKPDATHQFSVVMGGAAVSVKAGNAFDVGTTGGTTGVIGTTTGTLPPGTTGGGSSGITSPPGTGTIPTSTGGEPAPQTFSPGIQNAASRHPLYGGLSPWLGVLGLLGAALMAFGFKRLPDKVLEAVPSACPLQEN